MNGAGDDDGSATRDDEFGDQDRSDGRDSRSESAVGSDPESDTNGRITVDPSVTESGSETESDSDSDSTIGTGSSGPPGPDPTASDGPDPGANAHRNWTALVLGLSLASFLTAAITFATQDAIEPVLGAIALGVGFAVFVAAGRTTAPWLFDTLSSAWAEHRRSVWFATGLFAFGTAIGIVLLLMGFNLLEMVAELLEEELLPELEDEQLEQNGELELTAMFFIQNNTIPFLMAIAGALTLGIFTAFIMVFNGVIVGNISAAAADVAGIEFIVAALAPHGVFELPALFIAAGIGFRLLYRFGQRVRGSRDAFLTKPYLVRTVAFVVFGWLLLVLAAFVEAYVTVELLELLFPELLEQPEGAPTTP